MSHPIFWNIQVSWKNNTAFSGTVQSQERRLLVFCSALCRFFLRLVLWSDSLSWLRITWTQPFQKRSVKHTSDGHPKLPRPFLFQDNQLNLSTYLSMYPSIYEQCIHKKQTPIYRHILMTHSWIESPEPMKTTAATTTTTTTTVGWFVELRAEVLLSVCAARNMNYAQLQWTSQDPVGLAPLELYTAPTMKRAGIQYQKGRTLEFSPSLLLFFIPDFLCKASNHLWSTLLWR